VSMGCRKRLFRESNALPPSLRMESARPLASATILSLFSQAVSAAWPPIATS